VWALYTLMISPINPIHGGSPMGSALVSGFIAVLLAALLGILVQRLTERIPWPHPFRPGFLALHLVAAMGYSIVWLGIKGAVGLLIQFQSVLSFHVLLLPNFVLGIWFYVMVAGVSYATRGSARAARAEATAAQAQLAALRGQLNPHFLFNALHTVVQLIPRDPKGAARAAEQLAGLLRTTLEEDRDVVTLAEELQFVERYLELERIRFGDRLEVTITTPPGAGSAQLPSFALQTLVENAVRHGAAPRVEPTAISIEGTLAAGALTLSVRDSGDGLQPGAEGSRGTGLDRLRERLAALYGGGASLTVGSDPGGGCLARLSVPQTAAGGD
jgi:hypothetical protein